jgi:hypothetical protein
MAPKGESMSKIIGIAFNKNMKGAMQCHCEEIHNN